MTNFYFHSRSIIYIIKGRFIAYRYRTSYAELLFRFLHFLNNTLGGKQK